MREGPPCDFTVSSEPEDIELRISMLNGLTMSRVHMNTQSVTRIRSGRPVNAGGLDTHSTNNKPDLIMGQTEHGTTYKG